MGSEDSSRISSRVSKAGREPPFAPDPQLDVGLTERLGEVIHLPLELFLASRPWPSRVLPSGERLVGTIEELLLPLRDRGLAHLEPPRGLHLSHLAPQDREHDLDFSSGDLNGLRPTPGPP